MRNGKGLRPLEKNHESALTRTHSSRTVGRDASLHDLLLLFGLADRFPRQRSSARDDLIASWRNGLRAREAMLPGLFAF